VDTYRAITLSPVIFKLFELVVLELCSDVMSSDPLQFGFKKNMRCAYAIFTLKSAVKYFTYNGSSVYIAPLDIRKTFDIVNHFKMYDSLLSAGIHVVIIDVLCDWYGKLCFAARWNNAISTVYCSGVVLGKDSACRQLFLMFL